MGFHECLSDSKSFQVSRTILSILADLNAAVSIVSTCPLIYKPSSLFNDLLENVPSALNTTIITIALMFHSCLFFLVF